MLERGTNEYRDVSGSAEFEHTNTPTGEFSRAELQNGKEPSESEVSFEQAQLMVREAFETARFIDVTRFDFAYRAAIVEEAIVESASNSAQRFYDQHSDYEMYKERFGQAAFPKEELETMEEEQQQKVDTHYPLFQKKVKHAFEAGFGLIQSFDKAIDELRKTSERVNHFGTLVEMISKEIYQLNKRRTRYEEKQADIHEWYKEHVEGRDIDTEGVEESIMEMHRRSKESARKRKTKAETLSYEERLANSHVREEVLTARKGHLQKDIAEMAATIGETIQDGEVSDELKELYFDLNQQQMAELHREVAVIARDIADEQERRKQAEETQSGIDLATAA